MMGLCLDKYKKMTLELLYDQVVQSSGMRHARGNYVSVWWWEVKASTDQQDPSGISHGHPCYNQPFHFSKITLSITVVLSFLSCTVFLRFVCISFINVPCFLCCVGAFGCSLKVRAETLILRTPLLMQFAGLNPDYMSRWEILSLLRTPVNV